MPCDRTSGDAGFLRAAPLSPAADEVLAASIERCGYVMNLARVWAHVPEADSAIRGLLTTLARTGGLTERQCAVLVVATASARADSYCSLAWGTRLARHVGPHVAAEVLDGSDDHLDPADAALARWARRAVITPNATTADDIDELRRAGFDDTAIVAATAFAALRMAFSTINSALGARPDADLVQFSPHPVREAVAYGRPPDPSATVGVLATC